jgi:hypothetical protein
MAERDTEPKPFGKGALDGDLGSTTRAGRIRVLEDLIGDLEGSIRPVLQRLQALRGIVEQERDALFMEERRALRARERTQAMRQPAAPELPVPDQPTTPDKPTGADQAARLEPLMAKTSAASAGSGTKYSASSDGQSAVLQTPKTT